MFTDAGIGSRGIKSSVFSSERRTSPSLYQCGGSCRGLAAPRPYGQSLLPALQKPTAHSQPGVHVCVCVAQTSKQPLMPPPGAPAHHPTSPTLNPSKAGLPMLGNEFYLGAHRNRAGRLCHCPQLVGARGNLPQCSFKRKN